MTTPINASTSLRSLTMDELAELQRQNAAREYRHSPFGQHGPGQPHKRGCPLANDDAGNSCLCDEIL